MKLLDDAGIYVLLDVSLPLNGSIDRASPSWTTNLLDEYIRTINAFNKYPNILAYNIGNEVISTPLNTHAAREWRFVSAADPQPSSRLPPVTSRRTSAASSRPHLSVTQLSTVRPTSATLSPIT